MTDGRVLTCTICFEQWLVHEIPVEFIDPDLYVCPSCLSGEEPDASQLALAGSELRSETREYDPSIAKIPYGEPAAERTTARVAREHEQLDDAFEREIEDAQEIKELEDDHELQTPNLEPNGEPGGARFESTSDDIRVADDSSGFGQNGDMELQLDPNQTSMFGDQYDIRHDEWVGMPEFVQHDIEPDYRVLVQIRGEQNLAEFAKRVEQAIPPDRRRSIWFPPRDRIDNQARRYVRVSERDEHAEQRGDTDDDDVSHPRYPVFVPSKGRHATPFTINALRRIGVTPTVVVEKPEAEQYAAIVGDEHILELPHVDKGLVATRNWIWDYVANEIGSARYWTFDDNIRRFFRVSHNLKTPVADATIMRCIEDFTERYENVPISGMNYWMFVPRRSKIPPFYLNTRVYSNMLLDTYAQLDGRPLRNEGFYNDDTDLCLRVLKAGYCTLLFNAFIGDKIATMLVKGGMTTHYVKTGDDLESDGRYRMARELAEKHPDVARISRKWGRWQHHVDYAPFAHNRLIRRDDVDVIDDVDNYGMILQRDVDGSWVDVDNPEEVMVA